MTAGPLRTWLEENGAQLHGSLEIRQGELVSVKQTSARAHPVWSSSSPYLGRPRPLSDPTFGLSTWATSSLPADSTALSLPFELAVTPERSELALVSLLGPRDVDERAVHQLEERIKVLVYLVLHWIARDKDALIE